MEDDLLKIGIIVHLRHEAKFEGSHFLPILQRKRRWLEGNKIVIV
jgi:hypothetical protein